MKKVLFYILVFLFMFSAVAFPSEKHGKNVVAVLAAPTVVNSVFLLKNGEFGYRGRITIRHRRAERCIEISPVPPIVCKLMNPELKVSGHLAVKSNISFSSAKNCVRIFLRL